MKTLALTLVVLFTTSAFAQSRLASEATKPIDRSKNTGPVLAKWPVKASKAPAMHKELMAIAKLQDEFKDKKVLKLSVARKWKVLERRDAIVTQFWAATVGVFDPQNSKCWVWEELTFYRSNASSKTWFRSADGDVYEINCAQLK